MNTNSLVLPVRRPLATLLGAILLISLNVPPVAAAEGPYLVKDLRPGPGAAGIQTFVAVGSRIFFTADDFADLGRELYVSDGTSDGTNLVKDIWPGPHGGLVFDSGGGNPNSLTAVGERLFFTARDGSNGLGLYITDGTSAGTIRLMRLRSCDEKSDTMVAVGTRLVFASKSPTGVCRLYVTDGTVAGTLVVAQDIPAFRQPTLFDGRVMFVAGDDPADSQLWKANPSPGGVTKRIRSFFRGVWEMTVSGRLLYLSTERGGGALWRSDGTSAGTQRVAKSLALATNHLTDLNGTLVFGAAQSDSFGPSLWRTRGTTASTRMLRDFQTGGSNTNLPNWTADNRIYFYVNGNGASDGLWTTNGTQQGTRFLDDILVLWADTTGDRIYGGGCPLHDSSGCGNGYLFYTSDGTPEGTQRIEGVPDVSGVEVAGDTVFLNASGDLWAYIP